MSEPTTVDLYILRQSDSIKELFIVLHEIVMDSSSELVSSINYGLPFYKNKKGKPICYLTKHKNGSVDITFWYGNILKAKFPKIELRDRKLVGSYNYLDALDIDIEMINQTILEVLELRK